MDQTPMSPSTQENTARSSLPPPATTTGIVDGGRAAIVSTMRFPAFGAKVVKSFIDYHSSIGFVHFYLFFDDPDDGAIAHASSYAPSLVTVVVNDARLATQWQQCYSYPALHSFLADEVQARQHLNCEVAMQCALDHNKKVTTTTTTTTTSSSSNSNNNNDDDDHTGEPGTGRIDWLLHIDSDELFHTTETTVVSHFQELYHDNVFQMTYLNHEGVPEQHSRGTADGGTKEREEEAEEGPAVGVDYFKEITLFRRHHLNIPLNSTTRQCMQFWENRTSHGQYMLCYDNGKSACRVVPGARPASVHTWVKGSRGVGTGEEDTAATMMSKTALVDPRNLNLANLRPCDTCCILHYVCCGLPWLTSKYEMLGAFEDSWFAGRLPIAPSFHLDARDALKNNTMAQVWNEQVVFGQGDGEQELLAQHLHAGVLLRIVKPQEVLLGKKTEKKNEENEKKKKKNQKNQKNQKKGQKNQKKGRIDGGAGMNGLLQSLLATSASATSGSGTSGTPTKVAAAPFTTKKNSGGGGSGGGSTTSTTATGEKKKKGKKEGEEKNDNTYTYSKAWMMSQAVQNFL